MPARHCYTASHGKNRGRNIHKQSIGIDERDRINNIIFKHENRNENKHHYRGNGDKLQEQMNQCAHFGIAAFRFAENAQVFKEVETLKFKIGKTFDFAVIGKAVNNLPGGLTLSAAPLSGKSHTFFAEIYAYAAITRSQTDKMAKK